MSLANTVLNGYAGVYFSKKKGAALLFMAATFLWPAQGAAGLLCAAAAAVFASSLGYDRHRVESGLYSTNALLVGLALSASRGPSLKLALALLFAAMATTLIVGALQSLVENVLALPQMSLGFVLAAALLSVSADPWFIPPAPPDWPWRLPWGAEGYLKAISAVFFRGDVWAGLLVLAGLVWSSRIAAALSVIGYASGTLYARYGSPGPDPALAFSGFNYAICAIALGGVYCVPSLESYLLGALGAALCAAVSLWASSAGYEPLALPFLGVTCLALCALRVRPANAKPELTLVPASPEENLAMSEARLFRRKAAGAAWLRLPFMGPWKVTQGADGPHTHKDKWRHAVDFAIVNGTQPPAGAKAASYPAFGKPVLAPQAGIVSLVVDHLPDNAPGDMDTANNWGNYVSLWHADGSYSLLAHLKEGSIKVKPGERVALGEPLGLCGSSGRSPVPHIHCHIQRAPAPGGETLPFKFAHFIRVGPEPRLAERCLPQEGDLVKNLVPSPRLRAAYDFIVGSACEFEVSTARGRRREKLTAAVDLQGWRYLEAGSARLYYECDEDMLTMSYCSARPGSLLFALWVAASKVPLTEEPGLAWSDELPLGGFLRGPSKLAAELVLPFAPGASARADRRFVEAEAASAVETRFETTFPPVLKGLKARAMFSWEGGPLHIQLENARGDLNLTAARVG